MTTPDRKTLIGRVFPDVTYVIDERDINDYVPVAEESHSAFIDDAGARAAGYERRVIPPSFAPYISIIGLLRAFDWERDFYLDYKTGTAMFGEQELEYLRPLYVGEKLTVHSSVSDVYEKRGKRAFDVAQVKFTVTDERGAVAIQGAQSYVIFK
ncbi:MAG: MaoC family dehydratase N-terminal domain-containing protein [Deltaproteobacteria bacterium]|nr:MaoC family dehydratase N-terminal domain-containing protein [Deltaproteobacteria bacterium]